MNSYSRTMLDYRGHPELHAQPGLAPRSTLVTDDAPEHLHPRLTVNSRSYTQKITIVRIRLAPAAALVPVQLQQRMVAGIADVSQLLHQGCVRADGSHEGRVGRRCEDLDRRADATGRWRAVNGPAVQDRAPRPRPAAERSARRRHGAGGGVSPALTARPRD